VSPDSRAVLVMAGGTGGHVYPALAVADELRNRGYGVHWLGTTRGLEARVVPSAGFAIDFITTVAIRGKGIGNVLKAPWLLARGVWQSICVMRRVRPVVVLGMGGYVSVPGGIATVLLRKPLVIHEQNAVAGTANRWLRPLARLALQGFAGALRHAVHTGNPVRRDIVRLSEDAVREPVKDDLHVLVLGGSLGARAINETLPDTVKMLPTGHRVQIWHQTGAAHFAETEQRYHTLGISTDDTAVRVSPYIEDMANAYRWADLVICRAGAMTLAELTCAGLPAVLIPLPGAIDDHQSRNAEHLVRGGAACLLVQSQLSPQVLCRCLEELDRNRAQLQRMAQASRRLATPEATVRVADLCLETAGGAHGH